MMRTQLPYLRVGIARWTALGLLLLLSGCQLIASPAASASVEIRTAGTSAQQVALTPKQLKELNGWLSSQQSGWSNITASYTPGTQVRLKHHSGIESVVNIMPTMVILSNRECQYVLSLQRNEVAELRRIVGQPMDSAADNRL